MLIQTFKPHPTTFAPLQCHFDRQQKIDGEAVHCRTKSRIAATAIYGWKAAGGGAIEVFNSKLLDRGNL
ncbi:hypothetical protein [Erythrobacter neustonensis]|uniref:hypothetical protein n=1 Tax=Erythrobacter neustonensis TaxID=1112 RepID=UPI0018D35B63|nr:hypothetical protein [Erythrobacter neustonensis]